MSTYSIQGMTCEGCVKAVTIALQNALPDTKIEVILASNEIRVEGDHDPEKVKLCVEDAGFDFATT
jgi:copper chaperone